MKTRLLALALCLCVMLGLMPGVFAEEAQEPVLRDSPDCCCHSLRTDLEKGFRPDFSGKLIDITPQRVEDTFAYLEEVYTRNYPEAALLLNIADVRDRTKLRKLAVDITEGCTTDREKADAIDTWLYETITYDEAASAYANDTYYDKKGNCLSYANLMQALLRSLGIPAVMGDGWRGDMETADVSLFGGAGHA